MSPFLWIALALIVLYLLRDVLKGVVKFVIWLVATLTVSGFVWIKWESWADSNLHTFENGMTVSNGFAAMAAIGVVFAVVLLSGKGK
jgi:hypothetical protein